MLTITDRAHEKIKALMAEEKADSLILWMSINGRGPGGFVYDLRFLEEKERPADDLSLTIDGITIVVDKKSADYLQGAKIDYLVRDGDEGFNVENPNPLWRDSKAVGIQKILDDEINPAIASHGGQIVLLDVQGPKVYIQMVGGCQGCAMSTATLRQGVEVAIKDKFPDVTDIIDTTDHASGTNPYYHA